MTKTMNGAQSLLQTLVDCGVELCFSNPGTSEMHFVAALDEQEGMRAVLGLFEGVVTGAADGYARMAGKPACTLLHLGPGLANGLANLHNARRAYSPVVNVVGEHATYHKALDAPLTSNIEGFASPVSGWIKTSPNAQSIAGDGAMAVQQSLAPPGQVATLILPADTAWNVGATPAKPLTPISPRAPSGDIDTIAAALNSSARCALLLNNNATSETAVALAGQIVAHTGATLFGDTFIPRATRGAGRVELTKLPYFAEQALEALTGFEHLILVDTKAPVSFFAYPGVASELTPEGCQVHTLSKLGEDPNAALDALAHALGAQKTAAVRCELNPPVLPTTNDLSLGNMAACIAHLLPENAIVVNESATSGGAIPPLTANAAPHDWLDLTGGAIGMGIPAAVGAAVACPDRRVVSLQADGSGMYTVQGLWTQARENLDITTIIFANRKYAILQVEFMRVGAHNPGRKAMDMLELNRPDLDWVALAKGMGVSAVSVDNASRFAQELARSLATPGPSLIEVVI